MGLRIAGDTPEQLPGAKPAPEEADMPEVSTGAETQPSSMYEEQKKMFESMNEADWSSEVEKIKMNETVTSTLEITLGQGEPEDDPGLSSVDPPTDPSQVSKEIKYGIFPGAVGRLPWEAFKDVGFRTVLPVSKEK